MNENSLQPVLALNREIAALAATGLPLDIGLRRGEQLESKLASINASLAECLTRGNSLSQAIREAPGLPARYRIGLQIWLDQSDPTLALDTFSVPAAAKSDFGNDFGRMFFYPLLLLCVAYCGLLVLCLFAAPTIEQLMVVMFGSVEPIEWLRSFREATPWWATLFPVAIAVMLIAWRFRLQGTSWRWVPGGQEYYRAVEHANVAKQLGQLLETGRTMEQALSLVPIAPADSSSAGDASIDRLPSLMRWAIRANLGHASLVSVLHLIAESYRQTAEQHRNYWRVVMPTVAGSLIGGAIVLAYALVLFLPLTEMLQTIASPGGR